jgi:hypothetical protein
MPYIPKSRIQTNLYTAGREYVTEDDGKEYIGFYYKTYNGDKFTGKNPDDKPNKVLSPFSQDDSNFDLSPKLTTLLSEENLKFSLLKNININLSLEIPQLFIPSPTEQDYKLGEFQRYFCKKRNEFSYLEISKSDYDKLIKKDPIIDFKSWFPFSIPWSLTGDVNKVGQTNKNIVLLQIDKDKLYGFNKYLKEDYLKYYKV